MSAPEIEILNPGLLTTVQDVGRFGWAHLGISPAGAADPISARIANRLVGNDEGAEI
jgi:allophanate hydrolase subunit 2